MAEDNTSGSEAIRESSRREKQPEGEATRLTVLRSLAQQHLEEIGGMERSEKLKEERRIRDVEREARRREGAGRTQMQRDTSTDEEEREGTGEKRAKMRTAQDVLDRIRWDPSLNLEEYRVGYSDRFGGMQELLVKDWIGESTDEEWIPQHRIRYFKRVGGTVESEEVVWDRDQRVDKVFGSG